MSQFEPRNPDCAAMVRASFARQGLMQTLGITLAEMARETRKLAMYAAPTALGLNMHIYWLGIAADLWRAGDKSLEWTSEIMGKENTWNAEIVEQVPDQRIAWRSTSGAPNAGIVSFQPTGDNATRVTLRTDAEPQDPIEKVGDSLGFLDRQVKGDVERFKQYIEQRGVPTGAWRGDIRGGEVDRS